ncbi:MAG: ThiF family adenylyltransferase [Acidobacteriota bacterium]
MDFTTAFARAIELELAKQRRGGWRRANDREAVAWSGTRQFSALWRIRLPARLGFGERLTHFFLGIDRRFPWSEPRVAAPEVPTDYSWPHIEPDGVLCLPETDAGQGAGARAIWVLGAAVDLLSLDTATRRDEFAREFATYWSRRATTSQRVISLCRPTGPSREVCYWRAADETFCVVGDGEQEVAAWLANSGRAANTGRTFLSRLVWLDAPPVPVDFPVVAANVVDLCVDMDLSGYLRKGERLRILLGAQTVTGPVLVGVTLPEFRKARSRKWIGKKEGTALPDSRPAGATQWTMFREPPLADRAVERNVVERADAAWIHGRGAPGDHESLMGARAAVVGCGSLGSAVARLLAQAGVGELLFVDGDTLSSANTGRHVLGSTFVRANKARAMKTALNRDFPHVVVEAVPEYVENLGEADWGRLDRCDVVVSAGIDLAGEASLDAWRSADERCPWVASWVEEYAVAGHAVLLFGTDKLLARFDASGRPDFRLSDWPNGSGLLEAGCGNSFQPFSAIDLAGTSMLVARAVLDVLTQVARETCRREWLGDRARVVQLGGVPRPTFDLSHGARDLTW